MGYRLNVEYIEDSNDHFYGTKLYGYFDHEKMESKKYLKELNPVYDPESSYYDNDPKFIMAPDQFRKFIDLYIKDFTAVGGDITKCEDYPILKKMYENEHVKIVSWV